MDRKRPSALGRDQLELIFHQLNVFGLRLAPNPDSVHLNTTWPERPAQFDNSPAQSTGVADFDAVSEVQENGRFFLLIFCHRPLLRR